MNIIKFFDGKCYSNKTVLITGTSRGLGLAMVKELSEHGCRKVYAVCRKASEELSNLKGVTIIEGVDV